MIKNVVLVLCVDDQERRAGSLRGRSRTSCWFVVWTTKNVMLVRCITVQERRAGSLRGRPRTPCQLLRGRTRTSCLFVTWTIKRGKHPISRDLVIQCVEYPEISLRRPEMARLPVVIFSCRQVASCSTDAAFHTENLQQ